MNKLATVAVAAFAVATFGVGGALAQATATDDDFTKADANNDSLVSMTEAMGVYPNLTDTIFKQADANGDGSLDAAEFASLKGLVGALPNEGTSSASSSAPADTTTSSSSSAS